ncbi:MAG: undecaprenyl-phosphate galactose phosphotransferase WbaP [Acidobacteriota bacterium]|nr:undecaprenyl-phosphate galactose phosphotransferase WbaP [Acidobacteriota bacterium]
MSTAALLTINSATRPFAEKMKHVSAPPWVRLVSLLLVDAAALLLAAFLTATLLRMPVVPFLSVSKIGEISIPIALLCAIGLYSKAAIHPAIELQKITCAMALATVVLVTMRKYSSAADAQGVMVLGFLLQATCLILARVLLRASMVRLGFWLTPTVIIGSGPLAQTLVHLLEKHKHIGLRPVAILGDPVPQAELFGGRLLVDHIDNATRIAHQHRSPHVIIADPDLAARDLESITQCYTKGFEKVIWIRSHMALGSLSVNAIDLGGLLGLEVSRLYSHWTARVSKRLLDLALVSLAAVFFLPVLASLYLAIRLSSPGPVFYGQRRIGQDGRYFTVWKFRSMVINADAALEECLARDPELRKQWELTHKLPNDPRVSRIGKLLRKTSLDELPQLWNVVRGDMSMVGPRPIVDAEVPRYAERFDYYKMVRPGVTGMWQISGRSNTSYAERVRYDEYFVKNWSIWLDLYILFRTVKTVLLREGAC